jgi:hypothetical protein
LGLSQWQDVPRCARRRAQRAEPVGVNESRAEQKAESWWRLSALRPAFLSTDKTHAA